MEANNFLKNYVYGYMACIMSVHHAVPGAFRSQKKVLDPLEL